MLYARVSKCDSDYLLATTAGESTPPTLTLYRVPFTIRAAAEAVPLVWPAATFTVTVSMVLYSAVAAFHMETEAV